LISPGNKAPRPWPSLRSARTWLQNGRGQGIRIAVLDSGVAAQHPRLSGLQLRDDLAIVETGPDLAVVSGRGKDVYGHGTAVVDIIRATAPEAELGSIRVLGAQLRSRTALICAGARLALARGYHILNCSFGCGRTDHILFYKDWIDEAYLRGRHVVASCNNEDFTRPEWPGHFPTVMTAGVMETERVDAFLYRPGTLVEFGLHGANVEVAWLGGAIKMVTGSSFAAARLSGLLARLLSGCPDLHPLQAKAILHKLAQPAQ
jgi:hypothetical protein